MSIVADGRISGNQGQKDIPNAIATFNVINGSDLIAASGDKLSISAEANTAHDTAVLQSVQEINVQRAVLNTSSSRVEYGRPVPFLYLVSGRNAIGIQLANSSCHLLVRRAHHWLGLRSRGDG